MQRLESGPKTGIEIPSGNFFTRFVAPRPPHLGPSVVRGYRILKSSQFTNPGRSYAFGYHLSETACRRWEGYSPD